MDIREFIAHEKDVIKIDGELEKYEMAKIVHDNPTKILQFRDMEIGRASCRERV